MEPSPETFDMSHFFPNHQRFSCPGSSHRPVPPFFAAVRAFRHVPLRGSPLGRCLRPKLRLRGALGGGVGVAAPADPAPKRERPL